MSKAPANLAARSGDLAQPGDHPALILPYNGISPRFGGPPTFRGERAAILGRVTLGAGAVLGASSVIRADGHFVQVGNAFRLSDRATVHIAHDLYPTIIGDRVTVGANAVVHACTVGDDCIIGENSVVLDGSVLEDGIVLEAGSIVFPRSKLAGGHLYAGSPAKPVRPLHPGEIADRAAAIEQAGLPSSDSQSLRGPEPRDGGIHPSVFIASTARLRGTIAAAANSSVWFGCDLDANGGEIVVGFNSNIQDNTLIRCAPGRSFVIGNDSTIGHNVTLADCRIGDRALIGIGSVVASGTVIEDDVLLAAGSATVEGQVLERGYLWGRRPAQKMAPLDDAKRELIAQTIVMYCGYARAFAEAERKALGSERVGTKRELEP